MACGKEFAIDPCTNDPSSRRPLAALRNRAAQTQDIPVSAVKTGSDDRTQRVFSLSAKLLNGLSRIVVATMDDAISMIRGRKTVHMLDSETQSQSYRLRATRQKRPISLASSFGIACMIGSSFWSDGRSTQ